MNERLTIRNFGPIKEVDLEFRKFNVLIGENGTGKSTIAKLLAVCRFFSYIKGTNLIDEANRSYFFGGLLSWGMDQFVKKDSFIYYECRDYSLRVEHDHNLHQFPLTTFVPNLTPLSKEFKMLLEELDKIKPEIEDRKGGSSTWSAPSSFFQNDVASVLSNPFFISTERSLQSIFSLGKSSVQNISDSLFNQLASLDLISKNFSKEVLVEPLNISYKNVDGKGYVKKFDGREFFSLFNGASGYKSAIPIILVIKYYIEIRKKSKVFIVEEPELNLYPNAQSKLVDFFADIVFNHNNSVLLTTHSPYILTSLNNLMYAYTIGSEKREGTNELINHKYWVNPSDVSAFQLCPDGTAVDITDTDGKVRLIKAEKIDEISGVLNNQFEQLLNLEFLEK